MRRLMLAAGLLACLGARAEAKFVEDRFGRQVPHSGLHAFQRHPLRKRRHLGRLN